MSIEPPALTSDLAPLLAELLALAPVGAIVRTFGSDEIIYWSQGAEELYGWRAADVGGRVIHDLLHTRWPTSKEDVDAALSTLGYWSGELVHTRRDGERIVVASRQVARRDAEGGTLVTLELNADITHRRLIETQLRESDERFRLLVESVQDYAIFLLSSEGVVLSWNDGAQRVKGYRPEEIIGTSFERFYTREDVARGLPRQLLARAASKGHVEHEGWRVRKDGTRFWADVVITALRDPQGTLQGYAKVTRDLTERREAEEARARASREEGARAAAEAIQAELRASRDQLAAILTGVAEGIMVFDPSGRVLFANSAAARLCGFTSPVEMLEASQADIVSQFELSDERGAPLPLDHLPAQQALAGRDPAEMTVRFRVRATGAERWSLVNATPIKDASGQVTMAVSIFHDITERKRAEDAARFLAAVNLELTRSLEYEETLRRLAELSVPTLADWCMIDILRDDGQLHNLATVCADPARHALAEALSPGLSDDLARLAGVPRAASSVKPRLMTRVLDAELAATARDETHLALLRALELRSIMIVPLVGRGRSQGRILFAVAESGRTYDASELAIADDLIGRASLAADNAELYRAAQDQNATLLGLTGALYGALAQLELALQTRDDFLASASHDLKNPIASIKALAQLAERRVARSQQIDVERLRSDLARIDTVATRAAGQIEELLDVTRMKSGQLVLDRQSTDLVSLAREAVAEYQQRTQLHHITLEADVSRLIGEWDSPRLARVVGNLLDNALKYSPAGGTIRVIVGREDRRPVQAVLSIEDQGIGISEQDLDRIFDRFQRGTNVVGQIAGTGIGLASARTIVEAHGGTVSAASRPGLGATFTVHLPLDADREPDGLVQS
ncbi:MAG: PAS domain S-box protein [Chloroflexi bacterium]|nr:PAS domain S-box protein [Chloroflexota bacterium]